MTAQSDFGTLGLRAELVKACEGHGFRQAMAIQQLAIPPLMAGKDLMIQARTGSGKTLAYGLPLLHQDPQQDERPEALIVTPTRELARQIAAELTWASAGLGRVVRLIDGGGRAERQRAQLAHGCHVVVATPGRLLDLVRSGALGLDRIRTWVLDEADELIQRGFGDDLAAIAALLPEERQTVLCSATIPVEVETLAKRYARRPERVGETAGKDLPAEISHQVIYTTIETRTADLIAWLKLERPYQAMIFTGSRDEADALSPELYQAGLDAETFHGELSAVKRRQLIDRFRSGDLPILVATDIAARGLDLPGVTHVVNHSLPRGIGAYIHRTGRTGRAGKAGVAISLVIPQEVDRLERLRSAFAFAALTVSGPQAGSLRPLHTGKFKQSRAERRGLTTRWAAQAEAKAAAEAERIAKKRAAQPPAPPAAGKSRFAPTKAARSTASGAAKADGPSKAARPGGAKPAPKSGAGPTSGGTAKFRSGPGMAKPKTAGKGPGKAPGKGSGPAKGNRNGRR